MNLSHGNGAANLKENSMRQAFGFLTYYAMRRTLGALARLLGRMDRRERERQAHRRAHREDAREGQHPLSAHRMRRTGLAPQKRPQTHTRHNSEPPQAEQETP